MSLWYDIKVWLGEYLNDDSDLRWINDDILRAPRLLKEEDSAFIMIGIMCGPGIFIAPREILRASGSIALSLFIWLVSGLWAYAGATCLSELSASVTALGGEHFYIKLAYGNLTSFLYIWATCLFILPCSIAMAALALSRHMLEPYCDSQEVALRLFACCVILGLSWVHMKSTKYPVYAQYFFIIAKIFQLNMIPVLAGYQLFYFKNGLSQVQFWEVGGSFWQDSKTDIYALAQALTVGYYTFSGWNSLTYLTEDIRHPAKYAPKGLRRGVVVVIGLYLTTNFGYMTILKKDAIDKADLIVSPIGDELFGARSIMTIAVALSLMGTVNGLLFAGSRMMASGARQNQLLPVLSCVHVKHHTPAATVMILAMLSSVYLATTKPMSLVPYVIILESACSIVAVSTLLILRYKIPHLSRPFLVNSALPISYIVVTIVIFSISLSESYLDAMFALTVTLIGVPVYFLTSGWKLKPAFLRRIWFNFNYMIQMVSVCAEPEFGCPPDIISDVSDSTSDEDEKDLDNEDSKSSTSLNFCSSSDMWEERHIDDIAKLRTQRYERAAKRQFEYENTRSRREERARKRVEKAKLKREMGVEAWRAIERDSISSSDSSDYIVVQRNEHREGDDEQDDDSDVDNYKENKNKTKRLVKKRNYELEKKLKKASDEEDNRFESRREWKARVKRQKRRKARKERKLMREVIVIKDDEPVVDETKKTRYQMKQKIRQDKKRAKRLEKRAWKVHWKVVAESEQEHETYRGMTEILMSFEDY